MRETITITQAATEIGLIEGSDVGELFDHIRQLGIIKSEGEQLLTDCQIIFKQSDGHTDTIIVSASRCQWLLRAWMRLPASIWQRLEGIKEGYTGFWRCKKIGDQEFLAERMRGNKEESHRIKAHRSPSTIKGKTLQTYFSDEIDLAKLWQVADQLPTPSRHKHSYTRVLRLRFHDDGTIKRTFRQIADELGMKTGGQASRILLRAIRYMRHTIETFKCQGSI